jgi:hypothetical protein
MNGPFDICFKCQNIALIIDEQVSLDAMHFVIARIIYISFLKDKHKKSVWLGAFAAGGTT